MKPLLDDVFGDMTSGDRRWGVGMGMEHAIIAIVMATEVPSSLPLSRGPTMG